MRIQSYLILCIAIVVSFYSCSQNESSSNTLNYSFELNDDRSVINVTFEYEHRPSKDTTKFKIPVNFDRNSLDTLAMIKDIKLDSKGELIKIAFDTYSYIGTEKIIVIKYSIPSYSEDTPYLNCEDDNYFIPVINKEFFHFYADKSLILPEPQDSISELFNIKIDWLKFPNEWEVANDFGVLKKNDQRVKQYTKSVTIGEIGQVLFFGGNYRKTTFSINDINFHTFIYGEYKFPDSSLTHLLEKVAKSNLDLWGYFGHKNDYVISLTQKGNDCGRIGGRNMYNSFAIYMSGKFTENNLPTIFIKAYTHEFTHTWIGTNFTSNNDEWEKMKWFTEGFCEYYGMLINVKADIVPSRKFKVLINQNYMKYRLSPYANKSLNYYAENNHFSSSLENIAYTKGAAFAFYMDGYIRNESNSKYDLTDYMKALLKSKEKINGNLDFELMNEIAIDSIGIDLSNLLTKHIKNGEVIPLESPLIDTLKNNTYTSFDYGFDFIKSAKNEVISGVNKNSNAYKSGLRNGQKLLSIKSVTEKSSGLIILEVKDDKGDLIVEYMPKGEEINFPTIEKLISID